LFLAYSHAIVEELAGFGARVHTCSRNAAELEDSRRRWEEKGMRVTVSVSDVSVCAEREKLMETVKETFDGRLDILVSLCPINMILPFLPIPFSKCYACYLYSGKKM
jgi:Tropinone reductase 1